LILGKKELAALGPSARAAIASARTGKAAPKSKPVCKGEPAAGSLTVKGRQARIHYDIPYVTVEIGLPPQPKHRARTFADEEALVRAFVSSAGSAGKFRTLLRQGGIMRSVSTDATRSYEGAVNLVCRQAMAAARAKLMECPVEMVIQFRYAGDPGTWPTAHKDADLDNLEKAILDGMQGAVFANDCLVVRKLEEKVCSATAGISITVGPASPWLYAYHQLTRWFFLGPLPLGAPGA
jgi:Holliday junction resolvase RusA-like endonuclease